MGAEAVLAVDPDRLNALAVKAGIHFKRKEFMNTLMRVARGLAHKPDHVLLLLQQARIHAVQQDREAAIATYRTVIALVPDQVAYRAGGLPHC
ncbi:MAG: hypothetical protein FD153_1027 [Rhodospirillaceae bacterium]|nr:MAG: hypothetical protein FD153_1027 [Rhodospirillaceae bacterium]